MKRQAYSARPEALMRPDVQKLNENMTLVEVTRISARAITVFDDLGIDYACSGATSLRNAASLAGLTPAEIIMMIGLAPGPPSTNWHLMPLSTLTRHLTSDHSQMLSDLFPAVRDAIATATAELGPLALLRRMRELETSLVEAIAAHAASEEHELFPIVESLEAAAASSAPPPTARVGARVLRDALEHEDLRDRVHGLCDLAHELQGEYEIAALLQALVTLQRRLRHHMHLENNILYPRAIAIENRLRHSGDVGEALPLY
jgi:regulator of cell morphogenesis and NO signaling